MAVVDGSALLAAAVRAAILAKAPRRTVQSVAAAVAGVLLRPVAKAVPLAEGKARAGNVEGLATEKLETGASLEVLIAALVAARKARRRRKKENRCARADFASGGSPMHGVEVLQCRAVCASVPLSVVEGEEAFVRAGDAAPCASGEAPAEEVASCGVAPMEDDVALTPESGSASERDDTELTPELGSPSVRMLLSRRDAAEYWRLMESRGVGPSERASRCRAFARMSFGDRQDFLEQRRFGSPESEAASLPCAGTRSVPFYKTTK
jgi:hypothetical protein